MASELSNKLTIAFGTSGFSAHLTSVTPSGESVTERDASYLNQTATARLWEPGKLIDRGNIEIGFKWDANTTLATTDKPTLATKELVTITWPPPSGLTLGATLIGEAFCTNWKWDAPGVEEEMTGTMTIRWTGFSTVGGTSDGPLYTAAS